MSLIERFEGLLRGGKDNALLRFTLGAEYLKSADISKAVEHLRAAVAHDAAYSAAWKLLGNALAQTGALEAAKEAYRNGIEAAQGKGDKQAAKEMAVFLKRLERSPPPS